MVLLLRSLLGRAPACWEANVWHFPTVLSGPTLTPDRKRVTEPLEVMTNCGYELGTVERDDPHTERRRDSVRVHGVATLRRLFGRPTFGSG